MAPQRVGKEDGMGVNTYGTMNRSADEIAQEQQFGKSSSRNFSCLCGASEDTAKILVRVNGTALNGWIFLLDSYVDWQILNCLNGKLGAYRYEDGTLIPSYIYYI
eukprot:scaffold2166_cov100-Skeletonema_marinoi.AAC.1